MEILMMYRTDQFFSIVNQSGAKSNRHSGGEGFFRSDGRQLADDKNRRL